jgi:hypothetical protein
MVSGRELGQPPPGAWQRLEPILFSFFCACWLAALLHGIGLVPLADTIRLEPQTLFTLAAIVGWLAGNVYVHRRRTVLRRFHRRLLLLYLVGPPGVFFLLWAMAPEDWQRAVPLAAVYAFGVSSTLFLVPYLLRHWPPRSGD